MDTPESQPAPNLMISVDLVVGDYHVIVYKDGTMRIDRRNAETIFGAIAKEIANVICALTHEIEKLREENKTLRRHEKKPAIDASTHAEWPKRKVENGVIYVRWGAGTPWIVDQNGARPAALSLNEFQELAGRTMPAPGVQKWFSGEIYPSAEGLSPAEMERRHDRNIDLIHAVFGVAGEAGELIDPVKKAMFYGKELDIANIREEAGDLMWYIAGPLCRALGCTLEDLAREVTDKLRKRYPLKYTDQAAIERADKVDGS